MNATQFSHFRLAAYFDVGRLKYLYFAVVLLLYLLIIGANLLLILVICVNRSLHEPMYMFLLSLFANELYGSTGLFPLILVQILADVHTVAAPLCFLQIFILHCYGTVEYASLAVMSYDRYLAICHPLRYGARMSCRRVALLIAATWLYSAGAILVVIIMTSSLQLCDNVIYKVYCDNYPVVKLACGDTSAHNVNGLVSSFRAVVLPLLLILYTYVRILKVCFRGSRETRQKALSTCSPHLASILNFTLGCCFEQLQARFDMSGVPNAVRILLSLYFLAGQPLFSPLIYGFKLPKIRLLCKRLISRLWSGPVSTQGFTS